MCTRRLWGGEISRGCEVSFFGKRPRRSARPREVRRSDASGMAGVTPRRERHAPRASIVGPTAPDEETKKLRTRGRRPELRGRVGKLVFRGRRIPIVAGPRARRNVSSQEQHAAEQGVADNGDRAHQRAAAPRPTGVRSHAARLLPTLTTRVSTSCRYVSFPFIKTHALPGC
jgi:hypothetical protein